MIQNPFTQRKMIRDKTYFYGRGEELQQAIDHIRSGECCSVVGEPKIGKSSLLSYLRDAGTMREKGIDPREYVVVYFDFQLDLRITQLVLWQTLLEELASKIVDEALCEEISRLCHQTNISFTALRSVMRKVVKEGYKVVFLFDEFEYVARNRSAFDVDFPAGLRSLANELGIMYVTASRLGLRELFSEDRSVSSPFFNIFIEIRLGLLKECEAIDLIMQANRPVEPSLSAEVDHILRKAGRHPFALQILCYHLFNFKRTKGVLAESDLEEAASRSRDQLLPFFEEVWCNLQPPQRRALLAAAGLEPASSIDRTISRHLEKQGYIVFKDEGASLFCEMFEYFIKTRGKEMSGVGAITLQTTPTSSSERERDSLPTAEPTPSIAQSQERRPKDFDALRLEQLEKSIQDMMGLIDQYDRLLMAEGDPRKRLQYHVALEDLKNQLISHRQEYDRLLAKAGKTPPQALRQIGNQLNQMHDKLDVLLSYQQRSQEAILARLDSVSRETVAAILPVLDDQQLRIVDSVLTGLQTEPLSADEAIEMMTAIQNALVIVQGRLDALPISVAQAVQEVSRVAESKLSANHKLEVALPLVPALLTYKATIGLSGDTKLAAVWQELTNRFHRK